METKYNATALAEGKFHNEEFDTGEDAAAFIERIGTGRVVKFILRPNLPGLMPEKVGTATKLWTLDVDGWHARPVYSPGFESLAAERPH